MVTKSMTKTPFGTKLVYRINGECIWSEYLSRAKSHDEPVVLSFRQRAGGMLGQIGRGVRHALFLKAS